MLIERFSKGDTSKVHSLLFHLLNPSLNAPLTNQAYFSLGCMSELFFECQPYVVLHMLLQCVLVFFFSLFFLLVITIGCRLFMLTSHSRPKLPIHSKSTYSILSEI